MKIFRYIAAFTVMLISACTGLELGEPLPDTGAGDSIQIVGRVVSFTGCDVQTRAGKSVEESSTYSMFLAVFDSQNICKDVRYSSGSNITFSIAKEYLETGDRFYVFANIEEPDPEIYKKGVNLSEFLKITTNVQGIDLPTLNVNGKNEKCLPMVGSYLIDKANLPQIVPIPLIAVYAKIVCVIYSTPDQKVDGVDPASFTLDGFEVHNVASSVDFVGGQVGVTDDETGVNSVVYKGKLDPYANNMAQGVDSVRFSFYLPERFLKPDVAADDFIYPFGRISDLDEDEGRRYPQRYKPLLVEGRQATFVRFFGEYIDHQTHNYKVSYDVYLGNDNYGNFDIERNKQYNNTITIRGVTTSQDAMQNDQSISIDHRVNVERVQPIIINLRRETELDSHFEVRPLRVRKNPTYTGNDNNASVKVEVVYKDQPENRWVGLERSFGNGVEQTATGGTYLVRSELQAANRTNAAGKRRYFTTDLTTDVLGTVVENIPVTDDGECVWIYIDEAKVANARDAMRSAVIRVSYLIDGKVYGDPIDYTINQHELFPVTYTNGTDDTSDDWSYLIEYHEEYLHNYDAGDSFGQTDYEGMQWGLMNVPISDKNRNHQAILMVKGQWGSVDNAVYNALMNYAPYYDFYLQRDVSRTDWYFANDAAYNELVHSRNGSGFCSEIITAADVNYLDLGSDITSAVQYCYSRNKRNADGTVTQNWYLPAIDEIEEIVMSKCGSDLKKYSYSEFPDFRAKPYWSCQPAYKNNFFFVERVLGDRWGNYMVDNEERARTTSVSYNGQGADNPDNYTPTTSGMTGFYKYIDADYSDTANWFRGELSNTSEHDVKGDGTERFSGRNNDATLPNTTLSLPDYQDGALYRNGMVRVRCVRKR